MATTKARIPRPVALVTGASRRVGRAIAEELAARGCDLVLTYRRSRRDAEELAAALSGSGATVTLLPADFGDARRGVATLVRALGRRRIDILVHNASAYEPDVHGMGPLAERMRRQFEVNALAPALLTQALAPRLGRSRLAGGGAVVFLGDIHALGRPRRRWSAYLASKAAAAQVAACLALRLAPRVRVNSVAPGLVEAPPSATRAAVDRYVSRVPLGRAGVPQDAARAVAWLALEAGYVTGETVRVDGGRWLT